MKKEKLKLADLKVQSFVTEIDGLNQIKGGDEGPLTDLTKGFLKCIVKTGVHICQSLNISCKSLIAAECQGA